MLHAFRVAFSGHVFGLDFRQVVDRPEAAFRPTAHEAEVAEQPDVLGEQRAEAFFAHVQVHVESNHVVFAAQCRADDPAVGRVHDGLPHNQLCVGVFRLEGDARRAVGEKGDIVFVEPDVVDMKGREYAVLYDGFMV